MMRIQMSVTPKGDQTLLKIDEATRNFFRAHGYTSYTISTRPQNSIVVEVEDRDRREFENFLGKEAIVRELWPDQPDLPRESREMSSDQIGGEKESKEVRVVHLNMSTVDVVLYYALMWTGRLLVVASMGNLFLGFVQIPFASGVGVVAGIMIMVTSLAIKESITVFVQKDSNGAFVLEVEDDPEIVVRAWDMRSAVSKLTEAVNARRKKYL